MFTNETKILNLMPKEHAVEYILGIDEVGRGAGAGPVVVGVSIWQIVPKKQFLQTAWLELIADSKQLTALRRDECFDLICTNHNFTAEHFAGYFTAPDIHSVTLEQLLKPQRIQKLTPAALETPTSKKNILLNCVGFSLGIASNHEIDQINIWNAIQIAANRALFTLQREIQNRFLVDILANAMILMDGKLPIKMHAAFSNIPQVTITEGDALLKTIGFSSIIAKVARDKYMTTLKHNFPLIGFENHKGYLTKKHLINIQQFGQTSLHRKSFLKNYCTK